METKGQRERRWFTAAYKAEVVALCRSPGSNIAQVARDLDLTETAVRRWVAQAEVDSGRKPGLTTSEREELSQLRRENRILREERDILKRAMAFLARETR
jgi:transposase